VRFAELDDILVLELNRLPNHLAIDECPIRALKIRYTNAIVGNRKRCMSARDGFVIHLDIIGRPPTQRGFALREFQGGSSGIVEKNQSTHDDHS
jgi:hypothetical protein